MVLLCAVLGLLRRSLALFDVLPLWRWLPVVWRGIVLLCWYAAGRKLVGELNGVAFCAFVLAAWILAAQVLCDRGHYRSPCVVVGCRDE